MKIIGFGDLMLRLNPPGYKRFIQTDSFDVNYTGAEANVCVALSQYGVDSVFVTKLPENDIARCAVAHMKKYGVNVESVVYGGERIGLFYVEKGASQRASKVIYDRKYSAFSTAKRQDFNWNRILENADIFHFTGITAALSNEMPGILTDALETAKVKNILVSCDLNYRRNLWSEQNARNVMVNLVKYVDLLIANEEDAEKVLGIAAPNTNVRQGKLDQNGYIDVAKRINDLYGNKYVAISLRKSMSASDNEWSALLYNNEAAYFSRKYKIHIVDRVGGGDSFAAGLIYGICNGWNNQSIVEFAAASSCLKQTIEYDFNLASLNEIEELIRGDASGRVRR